MIYRFLFVLLVLSAAGCVQPVFDTPTAAPSPSPTPSATVAPSDTPTETVTPSSTWTATLTHTPTSSPTASRTPRPTFTAGPTPTADTIEMFYPEPFYTPLSEVQYSYQLYCVWAYFDLTWEPGHITVYRRDKAGYLNCIEGE